MGSRNLGHVFDASWYGLRCKDAPSEVVEGIAERMEG
jgi:hypothetical protein